MTDRASSVAIVGGGLAGMAAAAAAIERGFCVELFEAAPRLGGRAGSLLDATTGQRIDYCQHVAMGCCRRFRDFCRRTGIEECFERSTTLHFIAPDGTQHDFAPSRWLPAPLHLLPGLMNLKYLSLGERWRIVRALVKLMRSSEESTVDAWLQTQSDAAVEQFWSVVLVSALGETLDHASLSAARQVFREGFLASPDASHLLLPRLPLGDILHDRVGKWLVDRGVKVHLATSVRQIEIRQHRAAAVILADGTRRAFDFAVVAVPWRNVRSLFVESDLAAIPSLAGVEHIEPAAITAVHLWFDRPITALPHAVLVGRRSQWAFTRLCDTGVGWDKLAQASAGPPSSSVGWDKLAQASAGPPSSSVGWDKLAQTSAGPPSSGARANPRGGPALATRACPTLQHCDAEQQHVQVVISASHRLPPLGHDELLSEVRREFEAIWPAARDARWLHGRVIAQPAAVFSMTPEVNRYRPPQQTPIANLALAGDWTATGWPATMEGAVRSGLAAVKVLAS